jgi:hypothetical protein
MVFLDYQVGVYTTSGSYITIFTAPYRCLVIPDFFGTDFDRGAELLCDNGGGTHDNIVLANEESIIGTSTEDARSYPTVLHTGMRLRLGSRVGSPTSVRIHIFRLPE